MEAIKGITSAVVNKIELENREFLCGYYVCDKNVKVSENTVRESLRKSLPNYMVPTYFVKLSEMPYSINRKIDRKALPMPNLNTESNKIQNNENLNPKEKKLLNIWSSFDIGGDSISAINMQIEALKEGFEFEYADIFNFPTIKDLASKISYKYDTSIENYDYTKINKLLENNCVENIKNTNKIDIGNVLLIGVTRLLRLTYNIFLLKKYF